MKQRNIFISLIFAFSLSAYANEKNQCDFLSETEKKSLFFYEEDSICSLGFDAFDMINQNHEVKFLGEFISEQFGNLYFYEVENETIVFVDNNLIALISDQNQEWGQVVAGAILGAYTPEIRAGLDAIVAAVKAGPQTDFGMSAL